MVEARPPVRIWLLGLLVFALLALPAPRHTGSNVVVRFATTVQLIDKGTLDLGDFARRTNDAAVRDDRTYSDKAPGVSLLLAPAYAVVRLVTRNFHLAMQLCRLLTLTLLTLYAAYELRRRLPQWGVESPWREIAAATYAVGSTAWAFFSMLFSHGFTANFVLLGMLALTAYRRDPATTRPLWLAGAWFGLAVLCEYPAAVIALFAGLYLLSFERRLARLTAFALLGAVLPLLVIAGFNTAAFGHPFQFGYALEKDAYYHAQMSRGFMGFGWPRWSNLWLLTISPNKGLFFWSPVLALGVAGAFGLARAYRREAAWLGATVLAYVALFSGYFEASGGAGLGPRHLMPLVGPLVVLGACFAAPRGRWARGAFVGLAMMSSLLAWAGVFSDPQMQDRLTNPLWDFAAPMLREGVGPGNLLGVPDGIASLIALALLVTLWALLWRTLRQPAGGRKEYLAAGSVLATALAFYVAVTPQLPRTEPGLRHQIYGNHFVLREDYARAAAEYEQAFALRRDPWILYYQARAYRQRGDTAAAEHAAARWRAMLTPPEETPTGQDHGPPTSAIPPATH